MRLNESAALPFLASQLSRDPQLMRAYEADCAARGTAPWSRVRPAWYYDLIVVAAGAGGGWALQNERWFAHVQGGMDPILGQTDLSVTNLRQAGEMDGSRSFRAVGIHFQPLIIDPGDTDGLVPGPLREVACEMMDGLAARLVTGAETRQDIGPLSLAIGPRLAPAGAAVTDGVAAPNAGAVTAFSGWSVSSMNPYGAKLAEPVTIQPSQSFGVECVANAAVLTRLSAAAFANLVLAYRCTLFGTTTTAIDG